MDSNIKKILDDLYAIDPKLKPYERQLITMIEKLLASRPDTKFNKRFAQQLRAEILKQIGPAAEPSPTNFFNRFNAMHKLAYTFGGVLVAIIVIVPLLYLGGFFTAKPFTESPTAALLSFAPQITAVGDQAFGSLQAEVAANDNSAAPTAKLAAGTAGFGGGGVATQEAAADSGSGTTGRDMAVVSPSMILPPGPFIQYRYVYTGEPLQLSDAELPVFKRQIGGGGSLSQLVGGLNLGFIDLKTFSNTKLEQFSFYEDKTGGLRVNVSLADGSVSIYEGPDAVMPVENSLNADNLPPDEEIIAIATKFLTDHGIPVESFGQPEVRNDWRLYYDYAQTRGEFAYVPSTLTVVYPFIVDNQIVYDQSGATEGLTVNVDVVRKKATGLWNLRTQQYQRSRYAMETDASRITKLAENGGIYPVYYQEGATFVDVELGTPTLALVHLYDYRDNQSVELLVPSLIFPVTKAPTDGPYPYFQRSIVIPLAKDILDRDYGDGGPIKIMPFTEPGVSSGSAGAVAEPAQTEPAPDIR